MSCFYLIYDARYHTDPDRAIVLSTAGKLKEAKKERDEDFPDGVIVEAFYKKVNGENVITEENVVD